MKLKILSSLFLLIIIFNGCKKDPINPVQESPYVWVVGEQTVMRSTNAGADWYDCVANNNIGFYSQIQDKQQVYRSVSFASSLTGCISGDGGFFASTKNAQDWQGTTIGHGATTLYSSAMLDSSSFYLCGENTELYSITKTYNIGNPYLGYLLGVYPNFYGMDLINASTGWIVGDNSTVICFKNGWTSQRTEPGNTYNAVFIHKVNSTFREVWIAGDNGVVVTTCDDGETWNQLESGTTAKLTAICFTEKRTGYFAGYSGVILRTTDNGCSFQKLNTGTTENLNSISFMNKDYGFAVGDHGTFLKTTDAGNTWEKVSWSTSKNLYGVCFVKRFK